MERLDRNIIKEIKARRLRYEIAAGALGALAGAGLGGMVVGPGAAAAGAIVGAAIGMASGWAAEMRAKDVSRRDSKFD